MTRLEKTAEYRRLQDSRDRKTDWKNWGPYVSERAWGTVREDYSDDSRPWNYFPFDDAHRRVYRWNEDGLAGFCNRLQNVCLTVALWNGADDRLKERLFGVGGDHGNHGEDVKEYYFYLDGLPSHSYMRMLYRYPQAAFPYKDLVEESVRRKRSEPEYELIEALRETFSEHRFFDVVVEYAKVVDDDFFCRIVATNCGPDPAPIHVLPQIFFRNTWKWGTGRAVPVLDRLHSDEDRVAARVLHRHLGTRYWFARCSGNKGNLYFTENDSELPGRPGSMPLSPFHKDGINRFVVEGDYDAINPHGRGTKAAGHFCGTVEPGGKFEVDVRFSPDLVDNPFASVGEVMATRVREADEFYAAIQEPGLTDDQRIVHRQACAGLLWSKQFYHYGVDLWLDGDPVNSKSPDWRLRGRNSNWRHLYNLDVLSMPDKWEYPWYAAWDLAFHLIPLSTIDPEWAKRQTELILREWYMHPNGQLPAYEWEFSDVNPPVHAVAALAVFRNEIAGTGKRDLDFLERVFQKLLLNFTWWVNQKDQNGNNVFEGGFLGLDNIGVLNRSMHFPPGVLLEQADGTAWMAMYCLNMLEMALEIAVERPTYEDLATKFFEHFVHIAHAINLPEQQSGLWNEEDGFYYDRLHHPDGSTYVMRIRSMVGLIALFAVHTVDREVLDRLPRFKRRILWFMEYRPHLAAGVIKVDEATGNLNLSLVHEDRLRRILPRLVDPEQFLSDYGVRSLSKEHLNNPFVVELGGQRHSVRYEPAESASTVYGGNSNWRGPIWMPLNYLLIESLRKHGNQRGADFRIGGASNSPTLQEFARELTERLQAIFLRSETDDRRPFFGGVEPFQQDACWHDKILYYEYFHGDNGAGIGASHQTGWTALIANLIQQSASHG